MIKTLNVIDQGKIVLYKTKSGKTTLDVRLKEDTVWLTQAQMSELFQRERSVITKHISNVFQEKELSKKSNVQKMHIANSDKPVIYYSLDVIISVGYRVKSQQGTQFRIWATRTLKDHLVKGYTLNERRLREQGISELEQALHLLTRTLKNKALVSSEGKDVLDVITNYTRSWLLLHQYDENRLHIPSKPHQPRIAFELSSVRKAINTLKQNLMKRGLATDLFGQERGNQLDGILGSIEQTFDGRPLYPSVEEKAAHLLYFVIKDHPFSDGNKRIGSFLFILYLRKNNCLENKHGFLHINDNALVALALLIAESEPSNKDLMIRLIMNLITSDI